MPRNAVDIEQGFDHHHSRSIGGSDVSDGGSCDSQFYSTTGGSHDEEYSSFGFVDASDDEESKRGDYSDKNNNNGVCLGSKVEERECRICHMGLESHSHESGAPIHLGCSCKGDLGSAHKNCADSWFKIKGNKTCEICQSIARNVTVVSEIELAELANEANSTTAAAISASIPTLESRSFWRGHRFLNFLLACMVFAFVVSWLFHFHLSS